MNIEVVRSGKMTVVIPKGDLHLGAADQMKRTLTEIIDKGQSELVIDLGGVKCIDSLGLGALVGAMKQARAAGGDLALCALRDDVQAIFEMTRLSKVMPVHRTSQEALSGG